MVHIQPLLLSLAMFILLSNSIRAQSSDPKIPVADKVVELGVSTWLRPEGNLTSNGFNIQYLNSYNRNFYVGLGAGLEMYVWKNEFDLTQIPAHITLQIPVIENMISVDFRPGYMFNLGGISKDSAVRYTDIYHSPYFEGGVNLLLNKVKIRIGVRNQSNGLLLFNDPRSVLYGLQVNYHFE